MRGVPNSRNQMILNYFDSQKVTEQQIERKIRILLDFGYKKEEIVPFFSDMEFANLRSLDCFTDKLIREKINVG